MILNLDANIDIESKDIVAIINVREEGQVSAGKLLKEARQQKRILAGSADRAKSLILCAGARKPGGVTENARVYLSPVASGRLALRAQGHLRRLLKP